jgi:hypothetical protein
MLGHIQLPLTTFTLLRIRVFRNVTLCRLVSTDRRFERFKCLFSSRSSTQNFMNHLSEDTASPPAIAECSVTSCFLSHAERPAGIWYMVRNVLIAILKTLEIFQEKFIFICLMPDPSGRSVSVIAGSNLPGGMGVCFECCVLSGRGLCVGLITRPEEFYRLWCVVECDLYTS